jgi:hypothetical protein
MATYMNKSNPLVSADELEALIQDWGSSNTKGVDNFYPLRVLLITFLGLSHAVAMLFFPDELAKNLSANPLEIERIIKYIYFRGWFLFLAVSFGLYFYFKNYYFGVALCALLLTGFINLLSDLFNIYGEKLANPTPMFTLIISIRFFCYYLVFLCIRNISRIPSASDRWRISLAWKKDFHS